jgi:hypothetical protein
MWRCRDRAFRHAIEAVPSGDIEEAKEETARLGALEARLQDDPYQTHQVAIVSRSAESPLDLVCNQGHSSGSPPKCRQYPIYAANSTAYSLYRRQRVKRAGV